LRISGVLSFSISLFVPPLTGKLEWGHLISREHTKQHLVVVRKEAVSAISSEEEGIPSQNQAPVPRRHREEKLGHVL